MIRCPSCPQPKAGTQYMHKHALIMIREIKRLILLVLKIGAKI